ncbi:hypothetical protein GCM10018790_11510 [Kitasatospora xanthocidica]|uniref:hypothetical protein n=1 Tax=Kitasatospora xanthocidica TaxID=83382 RepID=UPI001677BE2D|nr:hypothetical protein [Kitasatospora xanthocidica]GHF35415.1 hypothetical protein GCM10018790_11510 [Kitasatospora xanthocidica]
MGGLGVSAEGGGSGMRYGRRMYGGAAVLVWVGLLVLHAATGIGWWVVVPAVLSAVVATVALLRAPARDVRWGWARGEVGTVVSGPAELPGSEPRALPWVGLLAGPGLIALPVVFVLRRTDRIGTRARLAPPPTDQLPADQPA